MERWERRARKLDARRQRMRVTGRGLITTEPLAIQKRMKKLKQAADSRRGKRNGEARRPPPLAGPPVFEAARYGRGTVTPRVAMIQ